MKKHTAKDAIKHVAKQEGVSEHQVSKEIEEMICDAIERAKQENNTEVLEMWAAIPCKGSVPTPEEFIAYMSDQVNRKYEEEKAAKLSNNQPHIFS